MVSFIIRIFGNILAVYGACVLISGFTVSGGIKEFAIAGSILGLLNITVKPFLKIVTMPVIILTVGIFLLVINGIMLWVVDYLLDFVTISNFSSLVMATIFITIVNAIVSAVAKFSD